MPANATVLYPPDATFNLDYYLKSHMPLVSAKWTAFGLQDWKVVQFEAGPDGSKPYSIAAVLTWDSLDSVPKALASDEGKGILDDVANFSDKGPIFLVGNVVGAS
jgi:uncharacterized protein (TIGR02118 family)